jgi:hypothetical protein
VSDATITRTVYQLLDAYWVDTDPETSTIAVAIKGGGQTYVVTCVGHKNMTSVEFISALRVATAGLIRAAGGDMSVVGCGNLDDAKFDTGNQRAN